MQIERVITAPQDLANNVWLVGNDAEVLIIDASHEAGTILKAVGDRQVVAILITHGHFDHINVADELADETDAPVYLHPSDQSLWDQQRLQAKPIPLRDGQEFRVGEANLAAIHTPGHTPGSTCFYYKNAGLVFTGDTLFPGGPGATRAAHADFDLIIQSIKTKLFTLPINTTVHPGHGESTTIGTEKPHLATWVARRW